MGTFDFIIRRILRSLGIVNERNHMRIASQQSQYVSEAEDLLGKIAWKDVADVPELTEEHFRVLEIDREIAALRDSIVDVEKANETLIEQRDTLELESENRFAKANKRKSDALQQAIAHMHDLEKAREAAEFTKKRFNGLRLKVKTLRADDPDADVRDYAAKMHELRDQYAADKRKIQELSASIGSVEGEIGEIDREISELRTHARGAMAEMMNRVSKSSKQVAEVTARIGSLEGDRQALCHRVGTFLSANIKNNDPDLKPVIRKYRNILKKIEELRVSIQRHRILGGRSDQA